MRQTSSCLNRIAAALALIGCLSLGSMITPAPAKAGSALIGGQRITCGKGGFRWANNVPGVGLSIIGTGIIMDNQLKRTHRDFQRFVFLHECAHQNYIVSESGADCWAIKRGVYRGYFSRQSIQRVCTALWSTPMGIAHNAGPDRCRQMQQCYNRAAATRGAARSPRRRARRSLRRKR